MEFPYEKYRNSEPWKTIETALAELEENNDLHLTTAKDYVVGYLCQALYTNGHVSITPTPKKRQKP